LSMRPGPSLADHVPEGQGFGNRILGRNIARIG
jgi:hypothetical protein